MDLTVLFVEADACSGGNIEGFDGGVGLWDVHLGRGKAGERLANPLTFITEHPYDRLAEVEIIQVFAFIR